MTLSLTHTPSSSLPPSPPYPPPPPQITNITFLGTPPKNSRLYFPYADPAAEIVLQISYQGLPNSKFIWTDDFGRHAALSAPPQIGDGSPHGSFYWDRLATIMHVKMTGLGKELEIRTDNAVRVSNTLNMDINAFFDNEVGSM